MRTGRILAGWPLLQLGGLATLWVVAMWVPTPQKYWLWTAGLLLDLAFVLSRGGAPVDRQVERLRRRMRHEDRRGSQRMPDFEVVGVETRHLDERLSLFMIIVLGEAVSQLVFAVASTPWTQTLVRTALLGFLMLVGLWWLTFWVIGWALPCTLLPLALAALGERAANNRLTLGLLACVGWMVAYSRLAQARAAAGGAVTRAG